MGNFCGIDFYTPQFSTLQRYNVIMNKTTTECYTGLNNQRIVLEYYWL